MITFVVRCSVSCSWMLLFALQQEENEEAFKGWLKEKSSQFKKEKLLKRRQEQEAHDGYYVRSREDCDKAFRQ